MTTEQTPINTWDLPSTPIADSDSASWQRLPTQSRTATIIVALITSSIFSAINIVALGIFRSAGKGSSVFYRIIAEINPTLLAICIVVFFIFTGVVIGILRWRNTRWCLDDKAFRVQRGVLFKSETLIPRTRVQHLDIERGPIERFFGLATLVLHTAGTRVNALRQHGFRDDDATALRDALVPKDRAADDIL